MPLITTAAALHYASLPYSIQVLVYSRLASTVSSSNGHLYPFPTSTKPTPHEIFHLHPGANQKDIKARYYELVRIHHPDSPLSREIPQDVSHARFRAITSAYNALNGKSRPASQYSPSRREYPQYPDYPRSGFARHGTNAEFMHHRWKNTEFDTLEDRKKDAVIILAGLAALVFGFAPMFYISPAYIADARHKAASQHLASARRDARLFGHERRIAIRERLQGTGQTSDDSINSKEGKSEKSEAS